jgi:putative ABC transport system ATP-binding protein
VNHPSLLLAAEPTGNLDSRTSEEILALLEELHRDGNTVVLVTHDASIGARAQRLVTIRDGRIESDRARGA